VCVCASVYTYIYIYICKYAQINYGGRVTDELDRRSLMSILGRFYQPNVLASENFSLSASGLYYVPDEGKFSQKSALPSL